MQGQPVRTISLEGGALVDIRVATAADVEGIGELFESLYGKDADRDEIQTRLLRGHAVVAMVNQHLIGYRLQTRLGPELLGDGSILVLEELQGRGLGAALVEFFEKSVPDIWKLSLVINSDLYATRRKKPDATSFWLRCGYRLVANSGATRVFVKELGSPTPPTEG